MMLQGSSGGFYAPPPPNMGYADRHLSGTINESPEGFIEVDAGSPFIRMAEKMYIRTAPQTGKATDTGLRAEPGAVYERIKRIVPKKFDKPSLLSDVKGYENGEMVYVWSLIKDPGKDEPLGWIVSSESVRLDDTLEVVINVIPGETADVPQVSESGLTIAQIQERNKKVYAAFDAWKDKRKGKSTSVAAAAMPSAGLSTGAKAAIAVGAAAVAFFLVRSARK